MAALAVFEDNVSTQFRIHDLLEPTKHEIVAEALDMTSAYDLLTAMALGDVHADYTLVDGNLKGHQRLFDLTLPPHMNSRQISVKENTSPAMGADGRQIIQIIRACQIPTILIGISGSPAELWGGEVDHDLTKSNLGLGLVELILKLEAEKNT